VRRILEQATRIAAVREHRPVLSASKNPDGTTSSVEGTKVWHVITECVSMGVPPLCIVCDRDPGVKKGQQVILALEVEDEK
jgi:hypothetical protein